MPVLRQFEPDLMLVSAGFDAHERDPLARHAADDRGVCGDDDRFAAAWRTSVARAAWWSVTEGGYDLHALAASLDSVAQTLAGPRSASPWPRSGTPSSRGSAGAAGARAALGGLWTL